MSHFHEVLKQRNFALLWFGQIVSQLGDRLSQMALIALVTLRTPGSTIEVAKILSFTIIPVFVIGPLAGVYVDRWDRRKVMYSCDLLRSALVLSIPFLANSHNSLIPVYAVIFAIFAIGRFFVPAKLAIVPDLVSKKDLLMANSLINTTGMIAAIIGFGISGIIVEMIGAQGGFYLDSISFMISGGAIFLIIQQSSKALYLKGMGKELVQVFKKSVFQELKEGIVYFIKNKDIRLNAGIIFVLWSALGAVYVVVIVFVQKTLHSATKDLGLLIMFLGIGLFLGSLLYGRFGQKLSQYKIIFTALIASGIMIVVFAVGIYRFPHFSVAAGLALLLGIFVSPIMIASNTIIHKVSDKSMLGKIFSSLEIVMHLGFLVFMFLSSFLAERFSHLIILVCVGLLFAILGVISLILNHKSPWLD